MATSDRRGWRLLDAREKLDEVVEAALTAGPQIIQLEHRGNVVVLSERVYDALVKAAAQDEPEYGINPDVKEYLLRAGRGPLEDPLDDYTDD